MSRPLAILLALTSTLLLTAAALAYALAAACEATIDLFGQHE